MSLPRRIPGLRSATLATAVVALLALAGSAEAARKRVVVMPFDGPGAQKLEDGVAHATLLAVAGLKRLGLIEKATGIEMSQVPFSSGALALQAMLAGTTDVFVASTLYAVAQADTLVALAIASDERDPLIPDVPTFNELGYDVISKRLRVVAGPPGLPENVVAYWADICKQVTDNPEFKAEMDTLGQPVSYAGPEEAAAMVTRMTADMQSIVDTYKLAE